MFLSVFVTDGKCIRGGGEEGVLKGSLGRSVSTRPLNPEPVLDKNCSFRYPV